MSVFTLVHPDVDKGFIIERWQDCEAIVENNKRLQKEAQRSDFMRHTASIPNVIIERWLNEELQRGNVGLRLFSEEFNRVIFRKLRDPEWKWLRTDAKNPSFMGWGD